MFFSASRKKLISQHSRRNLFAMILRDWRLKHVYVYILSDFCRKLLMNLRMLQEQNLRYPRTLMSRYWFSHANIDKRFCQFFNFMYTLTDRLTLTFRTWGLIGQGAERMPLVTTLPFDRDDAGTLLVCANSRYPEVIYFHRQLNCRCELYNTDFTYLWLAAVHCIRCTYE